MKLIHFIETANNPQIGSFGEAIFYETCSSKGYFIEPTVILTTDPNYETMCTELFGPVVTIYVFEDKNWEKTLHLVDETGEYALTGAVFSEDRYALEQAVRILENAAGNFYINDTTIDESTQLTTLIKILGGFTCTFCG